MRNKFRENVVLTSFIVLSIFLINISFINALEINTTACGTSEIYNMDNVTVNIMNDINVSTNGICITISNATNIIINGNGYKINSLVTTNAISTGIRFLETGIDGYDTSNVTIKNINFTGGMSRPIWFDYYDGLNNINLENIYYAGWSNATGVYFINGVGTRNISMNYLTLNNVTAFALYPSATNVQGIISQSLFYQTTGSNFSNFLINNSYISFVQPITTGASTLGVNDNYTISNSIITGLGNTILFSTGFRNNYLYNNTISFNPTNFVNSFGVISILNPNGVDRNIVANNNTFNNVTFNYLNPANSPFNICFSDNNFNINYLNTSNGVKSGSSAFHINRTCTLNNIGWLPPSYYVTGFYEYLGDNISFLRYASGFYPEYVYNFQLYNGTLGGYEFNQSGLYFNENLTFYTNNNYTRAGDCVENWWAVLGDCINNQQLLTYVDINMCGTTYNLPSNDNTYLNCTSSTLPDNNFNKNVSFFLDVGIFLVILTLVGSVMFVFWDNFKKRK